MVWNRPEIQDFDHKECHWDYILQIKDSLTTFHHSVPTTSDTFRGDGHSKMTYCPLGTTKSTWLEIISTGLPEITIIKRLREAITKGMGTNVALRLIVTWKVWKIVKGSSLAWHKYFPVDLFEAFFMVSVVPSCVKANSGVFWVMLKGGTSIVHTTSKFSQPFQTRFQLTKDRIKNKSEQLPDIPKPDLFLHNFPHAWQKVSSFQE